MIAHEEIEQFSVDTHEDDIYNQLKLEHGDAYSIHFADHDELIADDLTIVNQYFDYQVIGLEVE